MENYQDPIEEQFNRIQASKRQETQKKKVEYDTKNYLDVKLTAKETEKKITIRMVNLTPDAKTPFAEVHTHYLPSVKKSFVCAKQTDNLPEGVEKSCPFCDIRDEAKEQQKGANDVTWEKLKKVYKENGSMLNYVARVIDRGDEEHGIKFWKFSQAAYEFIIDAYRNNKADNIDIFDKHEGKDLIITIKKKEGKSKITSISAANKQTPLASSEDAINNIMTDDKVWTDVYGIKPYEYLEIVINGGTPFFDKASMKWVEKKEKEETAEDNSEEEYLNSQVEEDATTTSESSSDDLPF